MRRIGIAASKISKGNLLFYNTCVILISFGFSLLIFILAGAVVVFAIIIIAYMGDEIMQVEFQRDWSFIIGLCMATLTVVIGLFNIFAILKNIKLPRRG